MPIPKPRKGEDKNTFMHRCMGDNTMMGEFKDNKQRVAVCMSSWSKGAEASEDTDKEEEKKDE